MTEPNIGQQLKAARKAAGISVDQLADKLRLAPNKLELLEKGQFAELSAPTYVIGYIRSYCEEVNLDSVKVLEDYHKSSLSDEPKLGSTSNQPKQIHAKDPRFIVMTIMVLLFLLALVGTWAWESFKLEEEVAEQVVAPLPEIEAVFDEAAAVESSSGEEPTQTAEMETQNTPNTAIVSDTLATTTQSPVAEPVDSDEVVEQTEQKEASPAEALSERKPEVVDVVDGGRAPIGDDTVIINVSSQSWVNIKDANGYRLFYDMLTPSNTPLSVTGQAPFELVLGNASVVGLSINNTIYDVKRHMRADKSARFKLK